MPNRTIPTCKIDQQWRLKRAVLLLQRAASISSLGSLVSGFTEKLLSVFAGGEAGPFFK